MAPEVPLSKAVSSHTAPRLLTWVNGFNAEQFYAVHTYDKWRHYSHSKQSSGLRLTMETELATHLKTDCTGAISTGSLLSIVWQKNKNNVPGVPPSPDVVDQPNQVCSPDFTSLA